MQSTHDGKNASGSSKPKGPFWKIFISISILLIIALCSLIALLPAIASSTWGKEKLLAMVNAQIPGKVSIEDVSLSWTGPQEIHGLMLKDSQGAVILEMQKGAAASSLFRLFFDKIAAGDIDVHALQGTVETDASGTTNFERALNTECCKPKYGERSQAAAVKFHNVNANINFDARNQKPLTLRMKGETYQGNMKGSFAVDAQLTGIQPEHLTHIDRELLRSSPEAEFKVQADIKNLPVALLDQFVALNKPELAGLLTEIFGQQLNLNLTQTANQQEAVFVLNAQSPLLTAVLEAGISNNLYLRKPGKVTLKVTPALIEKLMAANKIKTAWHMLDPSLLELSISRFQFPLSEMEGKSLDDLDLAQLALAATLSLQDVSLNGNAALGTIDLQKLLATFDTTAGSPTGMVIINGEAAQNGAPFKINLAATVTKPNKWKDFVKNWRHHIHIDGGIKDLSIAPLDAHLEMDGLLLQTIGSTAELAISLRDSHDGPLASINLKSDLIDISLHDFAVRLNDATLADVRCSALCKFINTTRSGLLREVKGNLYGTMDPATHAVKLNFSGMTLLGENLEEGRFSGEAMVENWIDKNKNIDFSQATLHINAKSHKFPTTILERFNKTNFTALIGDVIDANVNGSIALSTLQGILAVDLHSELLNGFAFLKFDHGISLDHGSNPAVFDLILTPQGHAELRSSINTQSVGDFQLKEPAHVALKITKLNVPWEASRPMAVPYWQSAIDLDFSINKLEGTDSATQSRITLNNINAHLTSEDVSHHMSFEVRSTGNTSYGLMTALNVVGALEKGFKPDGTLNKHDLSFTLDATIENLPVPLICQLACLYPEMTQKVDAIIGNALNAKIKARLQQLNGPVYIELNGRNGHTILDAQLTNGTLTLNNDFYVELTVTPQLGKYVLQDLIPFLSGVVESDQPLKLMISHDGFFLSLQPLSLTDISIRSASLELGKMRFTNQGQLAKVLSLLTTAEANQISVWLTPAYFSFSKGIFRLERVDMLISERYPIAAWGKVNLLKDNVNMVIALSGAAIGKAFGVSGIRKNYMLQLPFKGPISSASIDKSKAAGRLTALVAQSQGGPHGLVLGTVLDIATGGLTEESPPEPTTNPLPWDTLMQESQETEQSEKMDNVKDKIEKIVPIEEIGKGAGHLIKKLFK